MRLLAFCLMLFAATMLRAQSVSARDGNIFYTPKAAAPLQLTSTGKDSNPVLAPDGEWVAFVRAVEGKQIFTGSDDVLPTELWQVRVDGKQATRLLACRAANKMDEVIGGFDDMKFSCDGKLLYFLTPAWTTSSALHVLDTTDRKEHFVCGANDFYVLCRGEYKDHLLVQQHRYFIGGGSYDWYWLIRPDGKEVGPVGEETGSFKATYGD